MEDVFPGFQDRAQAHSQDFQKGGSWDQEQGVGVRGEISENIPILDNIRMALCLVE